MNLITYLVDHRRELLEIALAAHTVAALICNLTPSPADDEATGQAGVMLRQAYRALEILGGIVTPLAKR